MEFTQYCERLNKTLDKQDQAEFSQAEAHTVLEVYEQDFNVVDAAHRIVRLRNEVAA